MKFLIAAALALCSLTASADEIMLHGISYHGERVYEEDGVTHKYNEVNPGVSYLFDSGLSLGVYKNSYARTSVMVGYRHMFTEHFGLFAGYATGYQGHTQGLLGSLAARTPAYDGWRLVFVGQPIGKKRLLTFSVTKEL